jgi:hypothetical protein
MAYCQVHTYFWVCDKDDGSRPDAPNWRSAYGNNQMPRTDFDEFVRRQQLSAHEQEESIPFDPVKQLEEWRNYLDALYTDVQRYLDDYVKNGSISVNFEDKELFEEFSGRYVVQSMSVRIGLQEIKLDPIGTMLIGSKGRVDVIGRAGTARLTLADKNVTNARQLVTVSVVNPRNSPPPKKRIYREIEWAWKIMSRPPDLSLIELNKESFLELLLEVSNG